MSTRCDFLRCLFAPPFLDRERVTCPGCDGSGEVRYCDAAGDMDDKPCEKCGGNLVGYVKGVGTIPGPIVDPRYLSSTVLDLAKVIRGGPIVCPDCDGAGETAGGCFSDDGMTPCDNELCRDGIIGIDPPDNDPFRYLLLSDALYEAGCDDEHIHRHLRSRCRFDTDGDGNCHKHPKGCPPIHVPRECFVLAEILKPA